MKIIQGDILEATEEFILQQCNCLTVRAHGLSESLEKRFPHAGVYSRRRPVGGRNLAVPEDRATPGNALIFTGKPNIICLFGQWRPGKTGVSYWNSYPESVPSETKEQRLVWFISGLTQIGEYFTKANRSAQIAVPYRIGCGLAGGDWDLYRKALEEFELQYPIISLTVYQHDA